MSKEVCSICMENQAKYTCPACNAKTCSVTCVKRHKLRLECKGQVDPTKFVSNKDLSSDLSLVNRDYNYLLKFERNISLGKQDVKTHARNVFRRNFSTPNQKRLRPNPQVNDPRIAQVNRVFPNGPQTSIKRENTLVVHVAPGMSRATQNKSGFDKKAASYIWTVEWVPVESNGNAIKSFISYRLKEGTTLRDSIPMNVLQSAAPDENFSKEKLHFYIENCVNTSKERSVIGLDPDVSLALSLKDKVVIEYPKIYVTNGEDVWKEYAQDINDAYGLEPESESESETDSSDSDSDSESSSDSDDSDDSDEAPEELSSKPIHNIDYVPPTSGDKPALNHSE